MVPHWPHRHFQVVEVLPFTAREQSFPCDVRYDSLPTHRSHSLLHPRGVVTRNACFLPRSYGAAGADMDTMFFSDWTSK
jgi:hypothetical protein